MERANPKTQGLIAILGGLVLSLISLLMPKTPGVLELLKELIENLGIATIIFGGFNILIDLPGWQKYFENRIKQIVIQQDYLDSLDSSSLQALEIGVLKAQFKNPEIEKKEGLLGFLRNNVDFYLGLPYRENPKADVVYRDIGHSVLRVVDTLSFVCRPALGKISDEVKWSGSYLYVSSITAVAVYPPGHSSAGKIEPLGNTQPGENTLQKPMPVHLLPIDGLRVIITAEYFVESENVQHWIVSVPCNGLELAIKYPEKFDLEFFPFVPKRPEKPMVDQPGYFVFLYDGWTLPNRKFDLAQGA